MRYYARYDNNRLIAIGTGYGGEEITESEYNALLIEIKQKAELVNRLYSGEIDDGDVQQEWREEIVRRVEERRATEAASEEEEATPEDIAQALEAIL